MACYRQLSGIGSVEEADNVVLEHKSGDKTTLKVVSLSHHFCPIVFYYKCAHSLGRSKSKH